MTNTQTIIGVAGASGAGKSSLALSLFQRVRQGYSEQDVSILHEDCYYRDLTHLSFEERCDVNFDHPDALEHELLVKHLRQFKNGQTAEVPRYNYEEHNRAEQSISTPPAKVIIVEGIMILHEPEIRELLDLKIFVDVPLDICLMRRMRRDIKERGRSFESVLEQFEEFVRPMYFEFVEPTKHHADLIIPRGGENPTVLEVLQGHLENLLSR